MFCSNCGSALVDGAKFCSECGARVTRPEPEIRTFADIDFSEPETAKKTFGIAPAAEEKPVREKVSFDWSNVVDEPHRKEIADIKSPWGTTGSIDEKELFSEMSNPGGKSRTMSFIDVLKAEKEERERAAADKAIEYTEVLHFDHDLAAFDEMAGVRFAPLYEDVDEPVRTPFDEPEFRKPEPVVADEPRFEDTAPLESNGLTEPEESELELSRETIAQFDEFVKSFEREAGIADEPAVEEPFREEPPVGFSKFELPDFLKKIADFAKPEPEAAEPEFQSDEPPVIELPEEPETEEPAIVEPIFEEPAMAEPVFEEPAIVEPIFEEPAMVEPIIEEPAIEEPAFEEPVFEEPKYDEPSFADTTMEDIYLGLDERETTGRFGTRFDLNKYDYDDEEDEDEEDFEAKDGAIDEEELFREMEESKPQKPSMTIAPPADKESEIEELRRRLAELTGVDLYDPADLSDASDLEDLEEDTADKPEEAPAEEPADELFAEPADDFLTDIDDYVEPAEEEVFKAFTFEPEVTADVDDLFEELTPAREKLTFEPEVTPEVDELFDALTPASVTAEAEVPAEPVIEAPAAEPVIEEAPAAEPVIEDAPAAEPSVEDIYLQFDPEAERPAMPKAPVIRLDGAAVAEEPPAPEFHVEVPEELIAEDVPDLFVNVEEVAPAVEPVAEPVVEEAPAAQPVFAAFEEEPTAIEDTLALFEEEPTAIEEIDLPAVETVAPAVEPVIEEVPAAAPVAEQVIEEVPAVAPAIEPAAEPVVEEAPAAVEEAAEEKESDALSLEELERDLFGDALSDEVEAEETKKIDKFYTLYRKNEEFQRLLDEEYEKLKHGGGLTEEEKQAVDAIPKMAEVEAATKAAVAAPQPVRAAPEAPAVPVEKEKAYRQVEDETIYMPKELVDQQIKADFASAAAAAAAPVEVPAEPAAKGGKKKGKAKKTEVEVEYEDVEKGSKFLTVLAVIIALILVLLLAVILVYQIAPNSGIAMWLNSFIDNLVSKFSLVAPGTGQYLL